MRIVSWNCKGSFSNEKATSLFKNILEPKIDILVIQECQRNWKKDIEHILDKNGLTDSCWYGNIQKINEGIGIFILNDKYKFECLPEGYTKYRSEYQFVLPFVLKYDTRFTFSLFTIWTKDGPVYKYENNLYEALKHYTPFDENTIIIGDYNVGSMAEKKWRYETLEREMASVGMFNCADKISLEKPTSKWTNGEGYQNDYCFASNSLKITGFEIRDKEKWVGPDLSDHCPIIVDFDLP